MAKKRRKRPPATNGQPPRIELPQTSSKPLKVVADDEGNPVVDGRFYLAWHKTTGTFYVGGSGAPWAQTNLRTRCHKLAIFRFRDWVNEHGRETVDVGQETTTETGQPFTREDMSNAMLSGRWHMTEDGPYVYPDDILSEDEEEVAKAMLRGPKKLKLGNVKKLAAKDFWRAVRDIVLDDPERFRKETGLRVVDEQPPPSVKLDELLTAYEQKKQRPSEEELKKVSIYWDFFTNHVSPARTVRDISPDELSKWEDAAWERYRAGASPKTLHHRFEYVVRILNYAIVKQVDASECERVLKDIKSRKAELPDLRNPNPRPISVEDFHALFDAGDIRWRAMLLVALNLCYYPVDVRTLPKSAINFKTRVVTFDRAKTGQTTRVGVLWKRTVDALRLLQESEPHDNAYVFISQYRSPYTAHGFRNVFREIRNDAGLPHVEFQHIRDGAYTAAVEHGATEAHAKILAGHRIQGMSDAYIKRRPRMVEDACAAIEQHYFGGTDGGGM